MAFRTFPWIGRGGNFPHEAACSRASPCSASSTPVGPSQPSRRSPPALQPTGADRGAVTAPKPELGNFGIDLSNRGYVRETRERFLPLREWPLARHVPAQTGRDALRRVHRALVPRRGSGQGDPRRDLEAKPSAIGSPEQQIADYYRSFHGRADAEDARHHGVEARPRLSSPRSRLEGSRGRLRAFAADADQRAVRELGRAGSPRLGQDASSTSCTRASACPIARTTSRRRSSPCSPPTASTSPRCWGSPVSPRTPRRSRGQHRRARDQDRQGPLDAHRAARRRQDQQQRRRRGLRSSSRLPVAPALQGRRARPRPCRGSERVHAERVRAAFEAGSRYSARDLAALPRLPPDHAARWSSSATRSTTPTSPSAAGCSAASPSSGERWKRALNLVGDIHALGEAIGKLYVERHYPPDAAAKMTDLVANLRAAFEERLKALDWMGPKPRSRRWSSWPRSTRRSADPRSGATSRASRLCPVSCSRTTRPSPSTGTTTNCRDSASPPTRTSGR